MANAETLTILLDDLQDFKSDKKYNASWADKGLYIVLSPIKDNFWSINVTTTNNLTTINPAVKNLPKYEDGRIMLVRRSDRSFTEYEVNWIEGLLFDKLKDTDLDFTCGTTGTLNPIQHAPEKQKELATILSDILEAMVDEGYQLDDYAVYKDTAKSGELRTDSITREGFAGFLTTKVSYNMDSSTLSVEVTDPVRRENVARLAVHYKPGT